MIHINLLCVLAALAIVCEGRVLTTRSTTTTRMPMTPWTTTLPPTPVYHTVRPDCDWDKIKQCQVIGMNASIAMYSPAVSAEEYSGRVCSLYKAYIDCMSKVGTSCHRPESSLFLYKSMCEYEGKCHLANTAMYCMSKYGPLNLMSLQSYGNVCRNLASLDECASRTMLESGCLPTYASSAFWVVQRLILEYSCYFLAQGLNNTCISPGNNCIFTRELSTVMDGILNNNNTNICSYKKTTVRCLEEQLVNLPATNCDHAQLFYNKTIAMLQALSPFCGQCKRQGNIYSVVRNTQCMQFSQSTSEGAAGAIQSCPLGTVFDVNICVCNFPSFVSCDI